jgi:hypothetical protein
MYAAFLNIEHYSIITNPRSVTVSSAQLDNIALRRFMLEICKPFDESAKIRLVHAK